MNDVSTFRLYLLRGTYLLITVGLALEVWPQMIAGVDSQRLAQGTVTCMLFALSVLAILGLRYPLKMLPLLFFEMTWKSAWLLTVALPRWSSGRMDDGTRESAIACLMGVIFPIVIPWGYVVRHYLRAGGDRWGPRARQGASALQPSHAS